MRITLRENLITIKQIEDEQKKIFLPNIFARGCGKSGLQLRQTQLYFSYAIVKDMVKNSNEDIAFSDVKKLIAKVFRDMNEIE